MAYRDLLLTGLAHPDATPRSLSGRRRRAPC